MEDKLEWLGYNSGIIEIECVGGDTIGTQGGRKIRNSVWGMHLGHQVGVSIICHDEGYGGC